MAQVDDQDASTECTFDEHSKTVCIFPGVYWHDDVIKWKHFPRYWPFVRGIPRSPVNSLHKGQWRGALMFSLICAWINFWVNNREAGNLRRYHAHYDVIVMVDDETRIVSWVYGNSLAPARCGSNCKSIIFKLVSRIDILSISCKIAIGWMYLTDA